MSASSPIQIVRYPIRPRRITVARAEPLGALMRRIVFASPDLDSTFPFPALAPVDHVKLAFPDADGEVVLPQFGPGGPEPRADGRRPTLRDYTIRAVTPAPDGSVHLTIDFALHDHGPAGRWATTARPGDTLGMLGPRGSRLFPADRRRYLLAADLSAAPALGRWLDSLPPDADVVAWLFVPRREAAFRVSTGHADAVRIVAEDELLAGGRDLADHLVSLVADADPADRDFVWAAGEATWVRPLRRHLRQSSGLAREAWEVDGYWKVGVSDLDHHAVDAEDEG